MLIFFWGILSTLILGLLGRIGFGGAGILPTDILIPLFCVIWGGQKIITQTKFPTWPFGLGVLGFVFVAWFSFLWNGWDLLLKEQVVSLAYLVRLVGFLVFGWASFDIWKNRNTDIFWKYFFGIVALILCFGFLQFYVLPDISTYSTEGGWDPHTGRLLGTWLDPNYLAGFLGFVLPLVMAHFYDTQKNKKSHRYASILYGFLALGLAYGLFLTFSRSGYLATAAGLGFYFWHKDWRIIVVGIAVVALGLATNQRAQKRVGELAGTMASVILQETDEIDPTASLRIQNWRKSFTLFQKNPVIGIGYNTYRYKAAEEGIVDESYFSAGAADSTHLTVLVTTGVLGFLMYFVWLWQLWWKQFKFYLVSKKQFITPLSKGERKGDFSEKSLGFCSGFLALCIHSCFVNSLLFPLIFLPVVVVYGVLEAEKKINTKILSPEAKNFRLKK
jgi:O-antigen ligase